MDINFVNTPKKYEDKADEVISVLFGLLGELLTVQERTILRFQRLEQKSLPYTEKCAKHTELFEKCIAEYAKVIEGRCTENEMAHKHPGSIGTTPEYAYIRGEYTVDFTMKRRTRRPLSHIFTKVTLMKNTSSCWHRLAESGLLTRFTAAMRTSGSGITRRFER